MVSPVLPYTPGILTVATCTIVTGWLPYSNCLGHRLLFEFHYCWKIQTFLFQNALLQFREIVETCFTAQQLLHVHLKICGVCSFLNTLFCVVL